MLEMDNLQGDTIETG